MNQKNNGGTAFPMQDGQAIHAYAAAKLDAAPEGVDRDSLYAQARAEAISGMSLRDYFAAKAMQAYLSGADRDEFGYGQWAEAAYDMADAMIRARDGAANAQLIAAAPDLLEALRGLDEAYCRAFDPLTREERNEDRKRLIAARAAIAKATGQPHD